jgi:hypothetical protein
LVGTAAQWREAGLSERRFKLLVASGDLVRVRRGCYVSRETFAEAEEDPCLDHAIRAGAAIASSRRRDCVASHHSAARVHGIDMLHPPDDGVVALTVEPGRKTGRHTDADVVRHAARLPGGHVTKFRGLPVTTAARTVVDIARTSTFMQGVVVADSAMHKRLTLKSELRDVLRDCEHWPGVELARRVAEFADWVPESPLESCARVVFHEHGLPPPVLQVPILGADGRQAARADFCWPEFGTIAETDGLDKYQKRGGFKEDHQRDSRIREVGWEVVHFLWDELFAAPADVVARIRFAFDRGTEPSAVKRRERFLQLLR